MKRWLQTRWDDAMLLWWYVTKERPRWKRFYKEIRIINKEIDAINRRDGTDLRKMRE